MSAVGEGVVRGLVFPGSDFLHHQQDHADKSKTVAEHFETHRQGDHRVIRRKGCAQVIVGEHGKVHHADQRQQAPASSPATR